jgi:hypothetical protein
MSDDAAMDAASEADRRWFARRPDRSTHVRPAIAGEFPEPGAAWHGDMRPFAVVRQIKPGVRVRLSVHLPRAPKDTEADAERLLRRLVADDWTQKIAGLLELAP